MKVMIDEPETQIVVRLRRMNADTVVLYATVAGNDDEQALLQITVEGSPTNGDPLGQRNERLVLQTLKVDQKFPAKLDAHGHIQIGMKA